MPQQKLKQSILSVKISIITNKTYSVFSFSGADVFFSLLWGGIFSSSSSLLSAISDIQHLICQPNLQLLKEITRKIFLSEH